MVNLFVAVTDYDWFRFLQSRPDIDEVNFWQPGGRAKFAALQTGELFLFKLNNPRNFIVGGGIFAHATLLPVSLAWESLEHCNGATSFEEVRTRIAKYRRQSDDHMEDYQIGCRLLEQPFFFDESNWIPIPASWSPNIVTGKTYSTEEVDGMRIWQQIQEQIAAPRFGLDEEQVPFVGEFDQVRYGEPSLVRPRLGQGTFRVAVIDAYDRKCAVTSEKILPVLEAAHIRPYSEGGAHEISNGMLLRSDIHTLFDRGYVTVTPDHRFEVSKRIREEFENGKYYYGFHGQEIRTPKKPDLNPGRNFLEWHNQEKFMG